jgi:hypothetical protein
MSTDCGAPTPIVPQFLTLSNPTTAGDPVLAGAPVVVPARAFEALTLNPTVPTSTFAPGMSFNTSGTPSLVTSPTSTGRDLQVNQQQSQNQINNNNPLSAGQPPAGQ